MRWKEFGLWLGFLAFCLGAGYLHGHWPDFRLQFFFSAPEKVRWIVSDVDLLPPSLVKDLEKATHTEIKIEEVKDWSEARLKTVLSPGAHLLLIPSHWIPSLAREGRLRSLNGMEDLLQKEISPVFRLSTEDKVYQAPLFWTFSVFSVPSFLSTLSLEESFNSDRIRNIELIRDSELFQKRMKSLPWELPKVKAKLTQRFHLYSDLKTSAPDTIFEVPSHLAQKIPNSHFLSLTEKTPLWIYSLAVPNNTPKRVTSFELIENLIGEERMSTTFEDSPLGLTLVRFESRLRQPERKPSQLQNLELKNFEVLNQ